MHIENIIRDSIALFLIHKSNGDTEKEAIENAVKDMKPFDSEYMLVEATKDYSEKNWVKD